MIYRVYLIPIKLPLNKANPKHKEFELVAEFRDKQMYNVSISWINQMAKLRSQKTLTTKHPEKTYKSKINAKTH